MKVIFIKDLKKQGKKDDIKEFKDGFAKYLINEGYAVAYTSKSLDVLNKEIEVRNEEEAKLISECEKLKEKLLKTNLKFKVKTGNQDKVFGSVSSKQICDELKKNGFDIDKKKIEIDGEINTLGYHTVCLNLHKSVKANIRIELIK